MSSELDVVKMELQDLLKGRNDAEKRLGDISSELEVVKIELQN